MIRTRSLKSHSWLIYPSGESIVGVNPNHFVERPLAEGDIVLAKDSNVGEVAVIDHQRSQNHMRSAGVVRLRPKQHKLYLLAFLKHPSFKLQVDLRTPRGATIRHAGDTWLDCIIPVPHQANADDVINWVSSLAASVIACETAIQDRSDQTFNLIDSEIRQGADELPEPAAPHISELMGTGRIDSSIYDGLYRQVSQLLDDYPHGCASPSEIGFIGIPGPSLEIKLLKTRIDSGTPQEGFYTLITPSQISEYGTINSLQYLGTAKNLPLLRSGDVLVGEVGGGRSTVVVDVGSQWVTNAHGLVARHSEGDLGKAVLFRSVFEWFRRTGLLEAMSVGSNGGHLSPSYWDDFIRIPLVPFDVEEKLRDLFVSAHTEISAKQDTLNKEIADLVISGGTWNLWLARQALIAELSRVQDLLLTGDDVELP
jgi:hypothetical protein